MLVKSSLAGMPLPFTPMRLEFLIGSSNTIDWDSPKGDLIKRAYWHCVLMETYV